MNNARENGPGGTSFTRQPDDLHAQTHQRLRLCGPASRRCAIIGDTTSLSAFSKRGWCHQTRRHVSGVCIKTYMRDFREVPFKIRGTLRRFGKIATLGPSLPTHFYHVRPRRLLTEERRFPPPESFRRSATVSSEELYDYASRDPESFWTKMAEEIEWSRRWERVLEWKPPRAKWFLQGKLNASVNCVDRHVRGPRRNKAALIWEGEPGDRRTLTYWDLYREINRFASVLKKLGVRRGDRVAIYLPMIPEVVVAMLACARIGAIHSVVSGGSIGGTARPNQRFGSKVLITADAGYRRGQIVPLKRNADKAVEECPSIEHVVVVMRRPGAAGDEAFAQITEGRDHWWHRLMADADSFVEPEQMDAEDILYILYTSGTTGKPKGIVHTTGGYLVGCAATTKLVFDLKEADVFWCTADVGWVTGHSYLVYGPLANGATCVMYEGAPDWPEKNRFWEICERYGVTVFYTAPTAIRAFMKWGAHLPKKHDLSMLRLLGSVGEPINPEAWIWYHENIGRSRCPIVDTWWQTETGAIMIPPFPCH